MYTYLGQKKEERLKRSPDSNSEKLPPFKIPTPGRSQATCQPLQLVANLNKAPPFIGGGDPCESPLYD